MDTRDKRTSAIGCRRLPWFRRFTLPTADGAALSQGDRQQVAFVYRGVLAGEAEPIVAGPYRYAALDAHDLGAVAMYAHDPGAAAFDTHDPGAVATASL